MFISGSHTTFSISILRKNKALELEKEVKYILNQMYLQQVQFKFDFQINDFNDNGIDNVKIIVSTNSGQPLQPLQKNCFRWRIITHYASN